MPSAPRIITLTTDFGHDDAYVGVMKGVILGLAPSVRLVDLSHDVPPGDIRNAALLVDDAVDYFPRGTIHVVVVDPGVGSDRAALAARTTTCTLIGPDNGVLSLALRRHPPQRAVRLDNPRYHLPSVSATFHGRDIFAPAAGHMARGVPLARLGSPQEEWTRLDLPHPVITADAITAHILRIDHFGNLVTDLGYESLHDWLKRFSSASVIVRIGRRRILGLAHTYADARPGGLVAYIGSTGRLEIAVRDGSAARQLSVGINAPVRLGLVC